tara:strand:+ start:2599 stop:2739 length:141 start_codon:yes stop_codon:yes gene_type:complete
MIEIEFDWFIGLGIALSTQGANIDHGDMLLIEIILPFTLLTININV